MECRMSFLRIPLTILLVVLSGCATQEYRQTEQQCSFEAFQRYPVNNVTQVVTVQRPVQIPTGQTNCITNYFGSTASTSCSQVMRTEFRNFQESVVVDTNASVRQSTVQSCTAQRCFSKYGNSSCKVEKLSSPTSNYTKQENCKAQSDMLFREYQEKERRETYERCMSK
jgi:hypothetical protein